MIVLFSILMIYIFGKLIGCAFRMTWGLTRILFSLVFLPVALIAMVIAGLIYIAFPILIVVGLAALIGGAFRRHV